MRKRTKQSELVAHCLFIKSERLPRYSNYEYYYEKKIFEFDPFQKVDQEGVGKLMKLAIEDSKKVRPDIELGICGEHGGNPPTVEFCHNIGLTYVSCSPFRVPIARLAAAQAAVKAEK